ncbi:MAG: PIN domain-containing protein [Chloroflexota bacterium]|nr:MAG: PIN domain-containing protein [Chloroflexota bacterium]
MILVDVNVAMYLVGADEGLKRRARAIAERAIEARERLVTDAEVFQEILHRYVAIRRPDAIEPCTSALLALVDQVFPIELEDVRRASSLVRASPLAARDALHVAIMQRHGIDQIMSFDRAFDGIPGLTRLS